MIILRLTSSVFETGVRVPLGVCGGRVGEYVKFTWVKAENVKKIIFKMKSGKKKTCKNILLRETYVNSNRLHAQWRKSPKPNLIICCPLTCLSLIQSPSLRMWPLAFLFILYTVHLFSSCFSFNIRFFLLILEIWKEKKNPNSLILMMRLVTSDL